MGKLNLIQMFLEMNNVYKYVGVDPDTTYVYAIGDAHGCINELKELIERCEQHARNDGFEPFIYILGDMIDRGPGFLEMFDIINKNDHIECIMGNHEYNFMLEAIGSKPCNSNARKVNHEIFNSLSESVRDMIIDTISKMPQFISIDFCGRYSGKFRGCVLSHSPPRGIEYCDVGQYLKNLSGPMCFMRSDPITDMHSLNERFKDILFVHGHQSWNYKPPIEQNEEQKDFSVRVINLDSGCVYGDRLTAMCLNTYEAIEVEAKAVYHRRDTKSN